MKTLAMLAVAALMVIGCNRNRDIPDSTGTFEATEIDLSSQEGGKIITLAVDEGQKVTENEVLVVIDTARLDIQRANVQVTLDGIAGTRKQLQNKIELAHIQLDAGEREYKRIKDLFDKQSATQAQMDAQTTTRDLAKNALEGARIALSDLDYQEQSLKEQIRLLNQRISDCVITSPVNGEVVEKYFEQGETAGPTQKILTVADLTKMKLTSYIPDKQLGQVKLNGKVRLKIDADAKKSYIGTVSWVSPKAEFTPKNVQTRDARVELVYAIRVQADNPYGLFKIGMPVDVYLDSTKE